LFLKTTMNHYLKHKEKLNKNKIYLVITLSFLLGFSSSLLAYVASSYFKQASGSENIGGFYLIIYGIILIALLNFHRFILWLGKSKLLFLGYFLKILLITALIFSSINYLGIFLLISYFIISSISWVDLDIILESFSIDKASGRIRGILLTMVNLGFLLGPILSADLLEEYGYSAIFLLIFFLHLVIINLAVLGLRGLNHKIRRQITLKNLWNKIKQRRNVRMIYWISFTLEFFYAIMVIYTPLYLLDLGFAWHEIGIIFTIMLLPFILFQYPAGLIADKKTGEKEMLFGAIFLMGLFTLLIFIGKSYTLWEWAFLLFGTRLGAALVEILRDSYFYKRIDGRDIDMINFFRTAQSVAYISAAILSVIWLSFFPLSSIFLLLALVVLGALYPAFILEDNN